MSAAAEETVEDIRKMLFQLEKDTFRNMTKHSIEYIEKIVLDEGKIFFPVINGFSTNAMKRACQGNLAAYETDKFAYVKKYVTAPKALVSRHTKRLQSSPTLVYTCWKFYHPLFVTCGNTLGDAALNADMLTRQHVCDRLNPMFQQIIVFEKSPEHIAVATLNADSFKAGGYAEFVSRALLFASCYIECTYCNAVYRRGEIKHCGICHMAYYCNKECQKAHWKDSHWQDGHKRECAGLASEWRRWKRIRKLQEKPIIDSAERNFVLNH
jgi:hypothetical protein